VADADRSGSEPTAEGTGEQQELDSKGSVGGVTTDGRRAPRAPANWLEEQLACLPDHLVAAAVVYPDRFWSSEIVQRLPIERWLHEAKVSFGVDLRQVSTVLLLLSADEEGRVTWSGVLQLNEPIQIRQWPAELLQSTKLGLWQGKPYRRGTTPHDHGFLLRESDTLYIATDSVLVPWMNLDRENTDPTELAGMLHAGLTKNLDLHLVIRLPELQRTIDMLSDQQTRSTSSSQLLYSLVQLGESFEMRAKLSQELAVGVVLSGRSDVSGEALKNSLSGLWDPMKESLRQAEPTQRTGLIHSLSTSDRLSSSGAESPTAASPSDDLEARWLREYGLRWLDLAADLPPMRTTEHSVQWGYRGNPADHAVMCAAIAMLHRPLIQVSHETLRQWTQGSQPSRIATAGTQETPKP
jgi:hypothetical protein